MGGIQALSRSTYSKLLPETEDTASFFSFYDVTEKIGIVIGMCVYGIIDQITGSPRMAIVFLAVFFVIGVFLLKEFQKKRLIISKLTVKIFLNKNIKKPQIHRLYKICESAVYYLYDYTFEISPEPLTLVSFVSGSPLYCNIYQNQKLLQYKLSLQFTFISPEPEIVRFAFLVIKLMASTSPEPEVLETKLSELPVKTTSPEPLKLDSKSVVLTSKVKSPEPDNLALKLGLTIVFLDITSPDPERETKLICSNGTVKTISFLVLDIYIFFGINFQYISFHFNFDIRK